MFRCYGFVVSASLSLHIMGKHAHTQAHPTTPPHQTTPMTPKEEKLGPNVSLPRSLFLNKQILPSFLSRDTVWLFVLSPRRRYRWRRRKSHTGYHSVHRKCEGQVRYDIGWRSLVCADLVWHCIVFPEEMITGERCVDHYMCCAIKHTLFKILFTSSRISSSSQ